MGVTIRRMDELLQDIRELLKPYQMNISYEEVPVGGMLPPRYRVYLEDMKTREEWLIERGLSLDEFYEFLRGMSEGMNLVLSILTRR